ncbi:hypothetical protein MOQ_005928 [Trypanosoma cruzi marinkellei]|uniref:Uncharacterized protein n=1 Tax=Trypanosoma cruzi marinkellei TaxID=85056 RepID=K2MT70_TRYCR|nr:hypothetical protein MOQ_005928 [Trypanosoma cruzi marinkellei]
MNPAERCGAQMGTGVGAFQFEERKPSRLSGKLGEETSVRQLSPGTIAMRGTIKPIAGQISPLRSEQSGSPPAKTAEQSEACRPLKPLDPRQATNITVNPAPVEARRNDVKSRREFRLRIASKKPPKLHGTTANDDESLLRTPKEERLSCKNEDDLRRECSDETEDAGPLPTTTSFHDRQRSSSSRTNGSEEGIPQYELPSVEERLRAIREERSQRLEKMQENVAKEKAGTIAPRPKTLKRVNQGRFKAIVGRPASTASTGTPSLLILNRSVDRPQTESPKMKQEPLIDCDVLSAPCLKRVPPALAQQTEEEPITPLEIEKDDQMA